MDDRPATPRGPSPAAAVRPGARRPLGLVTLGLLVLAGVAPLSAAGCAARPDRFAAFRDAPMAAPPDVRRGELTGRGGYASLGARVRLRDDTPPLSPIVEAERIASLPPIYVVEVPPEGPYGPQGGAGPCLPYADVGYVGAFALPGGGVFPGMRPPFDPRPSPFAAPYHPSPAADVARHRPGLSVGSGIYGRR